MTTLYTKFERSERVHIDGDRSLTATVTAYLYRTEGQYEISWVHNGTIQTVWIEEFRLSRAES